jgi:hypothetical protein
MLRSSCLVALWACGADADAGPTSVTNDLNAAISPGTNGIFVGGGSGVLVRSLLDGLFNSDVNVVPASFVHNDLVAPSIMYPGNFGSVWCPNDGHSGYSKTGTCGTEPTTGLDNPWSFAQLAVVINAAMPDLFPDFDNVQDSNWGNGVFYATDSNSVDQRCRYLASNSGFDCPGGWLDMSATWTADSVHKGAGYYDAGNPYAGGGGGGAGCHFAPYDPYGIQQTDAYDSNGNNLVEDSDCQCNYAFNSNWDDWVTNWIMHATPKSGYSWQGWFSQGKAPSFALDLAACWVNNPRDMIKLQNAVWYRRYDWSNELLPASHWDGTPISQRLFWGWNEVPVDRETIDTATNWDSVFIKLPAAACNGADSDNIWCLTSGAQQVLENDLGTWISNGFLLVGQSYSATRPGSYILFMTDSITASGAWTRTFYCQDWQSPTGKYQVVFVAMSTSNQYGACYLEWGAR